MRIISGIFKGRRFNPPLKKWPTRPTMDNAREALFNVLANSIDMEKIVVLDLFSGTSAVGLEFLSRGCSSLVSVDSFYACIQFAKSLRDDLELKSEWQIVKRDALSFLKHTDQTFDLIFCDPPYNYTKYNKIPDIVFERSLIRQGGLLILEHDKNYSFTNHTHFSEERVYGTSHFSFLKAPRGE